MGVLLSQRCLHAQQSSTIANEYFRYPLNAPSHQAVFPASPALTMKCVAASAMPAATPMAVDDRYPQSSTGPTVVPTSSSILNNDNVPLYACWNIAMPGLLGSDKALTQWVCRLLGKSLPT